MLIYSSDFIHLVIIIIEYYSLNILDLIIEETKYFQHGKVRGGIVKVCKYGKKLQLLVIESQCVRYKVKTQ